MNRFPRLKVRASRRPPARLSFARSGTLQWAAIVSVVAVFFF